MSSDYDRIRDEHLREYGEGTRHLDFLQRLYADRTHFIFELLQNAEDAGATRVAFELAGTSLTVRHDGRPFTEADVRGICGVSASTKDAELTAIGKFGVGFKSVYAYTRLPEIHSGDEHFRIRHYVRPEPAQPRAAVPDGQTVFVFPFDRDDVDAHTAYAEIKAGLTGIEPTTLLFLRNIHTITARTVATTMELRRTAGAGGRTELVRLQDGQVRQHQYWLTFRRTLGEFGLPGQAVEIAFKLAGPDPSAPVERLRNARLVAYFPTDKETHLGFLLQAPLRTTPARDNVPVNDPFNRALIQQAARVLLDALEQLRDAGRLGIDVLETLPIEEAYFGADSMFRPLFDSLVEAVRQRPLLPTAGGGHAPARRLRLARTRGVRELLPPAMLGALAGAGAELHWQPPSLTSDQHPVLWAYLRQQLAIEEVTPEWVLNRIDDTFLRTADDAWIVRLYAFLNLSPALWRQPHGPARTRPIVRLADGTHVAPFNAAGRPNAYLPSGTPSGYPTVRPGIAMDPGARAFLTALGLTEPDVVDEVVEQVLPRYKDHAGAVDDDQHARDLQIIRRALRGASGPRRSDLIARLRATALLSARTAGRFSTGRRRPGECYWPDDDLEHYFLPCRDAWFVDDPRYADYREELDMLGVAAHPRVVARPASALGHVIVRDAWGDHERGLHGFDPDLRIAGLAEALAHPDLRRSRYTWNRVLLPCADRLHGTVEHSTKQDYANSTRQERVTPPLRQARQASWLPAPDGRFVAPRELTRGDLPPEFEPHAGLADGLEMIKSVVEQASAELGIPVDVLRHLAANRHLLSALSIPASASPAPREPVGEPVVDTAPDAPHSAAHTAADGFFGTTEFVRSLERVFDRPVEVERSDRDDEPSEAGSGRVAAPALRRERIAGAIAEAQAAEPDSGERFQVIPQRRWDSKQASVRQFLLEQYHGRCQVCASTFTKRDGRPYFEAVYLVHHTRAAWVDRPGNVVCLCPTCAAKFIHGEVVAVDFLDCVRSWRTTAEGGSGATGIPVTLCGDPKAIQYTEKHLLELQIMLHEPARPPEQ